MTDEDNRNFVSKHFPHFLETFDNFRYPIQRADAIRACFLYVNGGIYMDLDFEIQLPLDDLFSSDESLYFVPSGNIPGVFTNAFMASSPKHPFWLDYIEEMKNPPKWYAFGKHIHVMTTTGPVSLSRVIGRSHHRYAILPSLLIAPCSVCDLNCLYVSGSYIRQLEGGSWHGLDSKIYNVVLCNWKMLFLVMIGVILILCWMYL